MINQLEKKKEVWLPFFLMPSLSLFLGGFFLVVVGGGGELVGLYQIPGFWSRKKKDSGLERKVIRKIWEERREFFYAGVSYDSKSQKNIPKDE